MIIDDDDDDDDEDEPVPSWESRRTAGALRPSIPLTCSARSHIWRIFGCEKLDASVAKEWSK